MLTETRQGNELVKIIMNSLNTDGTEPMKVFPPRQQLFTELLELFLTYTLIIWALIWQKHKLNHCWIINRLLTPERTCVSSYIRLCKWWIPSVEAVYCVYLSNDDSEARVQRFIYRFSCRSSHLWASTPSHSPLQGWISLCSVINQRFHNQTMTFWGVSFTSLRCVGVRTVQHQSTDSVILYRY